MPSDQERVARVERGSRRKRDLDALETPRSDWPKIQAWAEKWTAENVPGQDPAFVWAAVERIRHAGRKVTAESVMARLRQNGRAR